MKYLSDGTTAKLVDEDLALAAAREAFLAVASAELNPVVVGQAKGSGGRFTLKSGATQELVGVKVGSYWPENDRLQIPRHSSSIVLLDPATGRVQALIEAAAANAYRTAAADALAVTLLSREESEVLAVIGTGHQAFYEAAAIARVRPIQRVVVAGRDAGKASEFATRLFDKTGVPAAPSSIEQACKQADIITTATTATSPLFDASWIRKGTHISAMGADGPGKQELPSELLSAAVLFSDIETQSRSIGEFQHAATNARITELGEVLAGRAPGRTDEEQITVFDSSGFAIQDLTLAAALMRRADLSCS